MKYNLLGAVGTIALGAAFGMGTPGAANAGLTCVGTATNGSCSETDKVSVSNQDFTNITIPVDFFHNNVTSGPVPTGVLSGVTYHVGGTINVVGTLSNTGAGTATGQFSVTKDNFTFAGGVPSNFLNPNITNVGAGFSSPTVTLIPGQAAKFSISNPFASANFTPGPGGFTGVGTFNALVNTATKGGAISHPSDFSSTQTTNQTAFVTITYNYTTPPPPPPPPSPTPEPASLALLGVGLAGLGAIRRRRKA
jgi:hypothetical protein